MRRQETNIQQGQGPKVTRRGFFETARTYWRRAQSENPNYPLDNVFMALAHAVMTRRELLERFGKVALATAVVDSVGEELWEASTPRESTIGWVPGQKERLERGETDSMCLVFGGATVRNAEIVTTPIAQDLAPFGAVGYIEYANNGFDIKGIADQIEAQQRATPKLQKLSIYGHSIGTLVASQVVEELERRGSTIELEHLLMDCTPPDISHTDQGAVLDPFATFLDIINGSSILTAANLAALYKNPFQDRLSPPRLQEAQGIIMQKGLWHMLYLAGKVKREKENGHIIKVGFITPEHPLNDDVTDAARSRDTLLTLFPDMDTFFLETEYDETGAEKKVHASPDYHTPVYKNALKQARQKWGLAA